MIEYEISRPVYPKAIDRINSRVAVNIEKLGLSGVVHQIELGDDFRLPITRPGAVGKLLIASGSKPTRLETHINGKIDNKYAKGKLSFLDNLTLDQDSGSPSSELVLQGIDDIADFIALNNAKVVVAVVKVSSKLTYSPTSIVRAFERYNLGDELYTDISSGIALAWLLPEVDSSPEVQENLGRFRANVRREVGEIGMHPAELFPSALVPSYEEPA